MKLFFKISIPLICLLFSACAKEDNGPIPEIISNTSATGVAGTIATFGGNVIWMDGFTIMKKGVCYATTNNPSIKNSVSNSTAVPGPFTCKLSGLKLNTTYYARAYATYSSGLTIYGKVVSFTTNNELAMLKISIETISKNAVTLKDSIYSDGGLDILARGVCYGTSTQPTYEGASHTSDGRGPGKYISTLNNLVGHGTYFVRPYVTNSAGIYYGEEISFTLPGAYPADPVTDIDGNTYQTIRLGDQVWMAENLRVTHFRNGVSIPSASEIVYYNSNSFDVAYQCAYTLDEKNAAIYGRYYSWYACVDSRCVAPEGWHVPSYEEYLKLYEYLKTHSYGLGKSENNIAKALSSKSNWISSDVENSPGWHSSTNNNSDFNGQPAGYCYLYAYTNANNISIYFAGFGMYAIFQTTSTYNSGGEAQARYGFLYNTVPTPYETWGPLNYGMTIRCIKD